MNVITFRKSSKLHRCCYFESKSYPAVIDVWGATKTKENLHHIHFLTHRDAWENVNCSAGKETFYLTDSSRPNRHRYVAPACKIVGPRVWFGNKFSMKRSRTRHNNSDALRTKERNITDGLGCQDSWGGGNSTYVDLRRIRAGHLNLKKSCGLAEKSVNVVSTVSTITVGPSLNLSKQRPVGCPIGRNELHENGK